MSMRQHFLLGSHCCLAFEYLSLSGQIRPIRPTPGHFARIQCHTFHPRYRAMSSPSSSTPTGASEERVKGHASQVGASAPLEATDLFATAFRLSSFPSLTSPTTLEEKLTRAYGANYPPMELASFSHKQPTTSSPRHYSMFTALVPTARMGLCCTGS